VSGFGLAEHKPCRESPAGDPRDPWSNATQPCADKEVRPRAACGRDDALAQIKGQKIKTIAAAAADKRRVRHTRSVTVVSLPTGNRHPRFLPVDGTAHCRGLWRDRAPAAPRSCRQAHRSTHFTLRILSSCTISLRAAAAASQVQPRHPSWRSRAIPRPRKWCA